MAGRLPRVTAAEMRRKLIRDGWVVARDTGHHTTFSHPTKPGHVQVSRHMTEVLKPKTLRSILQQAGLTAEQFQQL